MKNKPQVPKGVYTCAALLVLAAVFSFLDSSMYSVWFMVGATANVIVAAGLFVRSAKACRYVVILSLVMMTVGLVGFLDYSRTIRDLHDETAQARGIVAAVQSESFTPAQIEQLQAHDKKINDLHKQAGSSETLTHIKFGLIIIGYSFVVLYLTQPAVRKSFTAK